MRAWPLPEKSEEMVPLFQGEFWETTRVALRVEPCRTMLDMGITPAADRAGRRLQMAGHFAHSPAFLEESHGHPTTDCQVLFRACGSHMTLIGITNQFL